MPIADCLLDGQSRRRGVGALVGSFQSVKHRLADDATALEGARLLAERRLGLPRGRPGR
jgi:alkylation response protein AidB-like acyl-CoA dehydrogenase